MNGQRTRRLRSSEEQKQNTSGLRPMHISLRSGERLFLNGAVLRVDRKVTLELLNDATFLLENHVLQVEDTTTPLRQLYFAAQAMLMDPQNAKASRSLFDAMAADLRRCLATGKLIAGLDEVCALVSQDRTFQALKALRGLFEEEADVLAQRGVPHPPAERRPGEAARRREVETIPPVISPQGFAAGENAAPGGPNRHLPTLQQGAPGVSTMDPLNPTAPAQPLAVANEASVAAAKQQTLDYDAFLRLLVEQMKNQDPLEPTSDTEYVAQLATFSNVEQNIITNDRLMSLITATTLTDAQALIGHTVTTSTGESGVVASVRIASGEMMATLADGSVVSVGDGITVS